MIAIDGLPDQGVGEVVSHRNQWGCKVFGRFFEEGLSLVVRLKQRDHFPAQVGVVPAVFIERGGTLGWRLFQHRVEHHVDLLPAFGGHEELLGLNRAYGAKAVV